MESRHFWKAVSLITLKYYLSCDFHPDKQFWLFLAKSNLSMWLLILDFIIASIVFTVFKWNVLFCSSPDLPWRLKNGVTFPAFWFSRNELDFKWQLTLNTFTSVHVFLQKARANTIWSFWFPTFQFIDLSQKSLLTLQFETLCKERLWWKPPWLSQDLILFFFNGPVFLESLFYSCIWLCRLSALLLAFDALEILLAFFSLASFVRILCALKGPVKL